MVDRHRVEAGQKGARIMWKKRRARDAANAAKLALFHEMADVLKLMAYPKFTTDDQGRIHYYVTKSDVESARTVIKAIEAAANTTNGQQEQTNGRQG